MSRILGDLTYSRQVPTYVEKPFEVIEGTLQKLEDRYYTNRDTADKFEIMMSNLDVLDQDKYIKDASLSAIQGTFDQISKKGDWENASLVIRDMAKNFAMDEPLKLASKNYKKKQSDLAHLQKRIDEGEISQGDANYARALAEQEYTGVHQDSSGGWNGVYGIRQPPKYEDRGMYVIDAMEGFKPDENTSFERDKDGRLVAVTQVMTKDGVFTGIPNREYVSDQELWDASMSLLSQNTPMMERLRWEVAKDAKTMDDYLATDPGAKESMKDDLKKMGYDDKDLKDMSDDKLVSTYELQMAMASSIIPAMKKYGFDKTTWDSLGMTMEAKLRIEEENNAGDDKTREHITMLNHTLTNWITNPDSVSSTADYNNITGNTTALVNGSNEVIEASNRELTNLRTKKEKLTAEEKDTKKIDEQIALETAKIAREDTKINNYKRLQRAAQNEYDIATDEAIETLRDKYGDAYIKTSTAQVDEQNKKKQAIQPVLERVAKASNMLNDPNWIEKAINFVTQYVPGGATGIEVKYGKELTDKEKASLLAEYPYLDSSGTVFSDSGIKELRDNLLITKEDYKAFKEYENYHRTNVNKVNQFGKTLENERNKVLAANARKDASRFNVIDLSTKMDGSWSDFSNVTTTHLQQYWQEYQMINADDGELLSLNMRDNENIINPANVRVVGRTADHVGSLGELLVVNEYNVDEDTGKVIYNNPKRQVLVKPPEGTDFETLAIHEVRKGQVYNKGAYKEKGYNIEDRNKIEAIWTYDSVAPQLAVFQRHAAVRPQDIGSSAETTSTTAPLALGGKFRGEAIRRIDRSNNHEYSVVLTDRKTGEVISKKYQDYYHMQIELEALAGHGYNVPSSAMERVDKDTFKYGKVKSPNTMMVQLAPPMVPQAKIIDNIIGETWFITDLFRTEQMNKNVKGAENSAHKYGLSIDGAYTESAHKKLLAASTSIGNGWFSINREGANIMWMVHEDKDHAKHLHFQMENEPVGFRDQFDVLSSFDRVN